jgi:hypothetical protein
MVFIAFQDMEDMITMAVGMEITEAMVVMITVDMVDMETMVITMFFSFVCGSLWLSLLSSLT